MPPRNDIETLIEDLKKARRGRAGCAPAIKQLADSVGSLLRAPPSQLAGKISDLWNHARTRPHPFDAALAPRRHSSARFNQDIWWLQLLVMVAQGLGTRRRWIIPKTLDPKVSSAKAAAQAARIAWDRYVTDRGSQAIGDLIDAIELLLDQVPKGLSLTGNLLVKDGVQISRALTRKQAVFMQLLIDYNGKPVSDSDFRKRGIMRADLIKTRLLHDPNFSFLEYHIASENGVGYRLIP